ncbi:MAG: cation-transporting P-type ATPase [Blautia wexlerae]
MKNGLSNEQVEESRRLHGSNKLPEPELKKWYHFAKEALTEKITMILVTIAILQMVLNIRCNGIIRTNYDHLSSCNCNWYRN